MTNAIIKTMDDAERAARSMSASGFFQDSKSAAQAVVKILAGQELGFGPFASMTGVNIIQNKPVLAANLLAASVKRTTKYNYRVTVQTDHECVLTWFEDGQEVGKSSFTMDDAKMAGLSTKDNWKKYPSDMLFARALSRGQKRYAPDIFNGATVYTPDELGAVVDEEGNVVDAVELSDEQKQADAQKAEDERKEIATNMYLKLIDRASKVNLMLPELPDGTSEYMKGFYNEQLHFVKEAEKQAKAGE